MRLLVVPKRMKVGKMTDIYLYCVLSLLSFLVFGCRNSVKSPVRTDKIFANYYIRYQEDVKQFKAQATFFAGDSLPTARAKVFLEGVSLNNEAMSRKQLNENLIRYELVSKREFSAPYAFRYHDDGRNLREFSINLETFGVFSVKDSKISQSIGGRIELENGNLKAGEKLIILLIDQNNKTSTQSFSGPLDNSLYIIGEEHVKQLAPGPASLYLVKRSDQMTREGTTEISATIEYYSAVQEFEILE